MKMRGSLAVAFTFAVLALAPSAASAWAPADQATIHPGVQTFTDGGQCTANFIYTGGGNTYIGQAAHCAGTGAATDTNGCDAGSLPLGTPVEIDRRHPARHARLQLLDHDAAARRDQRRRLRVQRLRARAGSTRRTSAKVNPSVPGFGGPDGRRRAQRRAAPTSTRTATRRCAAASPS